MNENQEFEKTVDAEFSQKQEGHEYPRGKWSFTFRRKNRQNTIVNQLTNIYSILTIIVFVVFGAVYNLWHPLWVIFFSIPLMNTLFRAIVFRKIHYFAFEIAIVIGYVIVGITTKIWHPTWAMLLAIPLYRSVVSLINSIKKNKAESIEEGIFGVYTKEDDEE